MLITQILTATVLLILLFGYDDWFFRYPSQVLIILGLLFPKLLIRSELWFLLACLATGTILAHWQPVDNHKYLLCYWLWTLYLAAEIGRNVPSRALIASNARFLIVFTMLAAVIQKSLSQTYLDGSFFELTLLTDKRFGFLASSFGMSREALEELWWKFSLLQSPLTSISVQEMQITIPKQIGLVAVVITYWNFLAQIVIGTTFAIRQTWADMVGHIVLITFLVTTYIAAPVFGFGWLLCIFGISVTGPQQVRFRYAYFAAMLLILFYQIPFRDFLI